MEVLTTPVADKVKEARDTLDTQVRDMVAWHFNPSTGCPFWLEFAGELDFDPRREIGGYSDLKYLGHFQDEWLRGGPVRQTESDPPRVGSGNGSGESAERDSRVAGPIGGERSTPDRRHSTARDTTRVPFSICCNPSAAARSGAS